MTEEELDTKVMLLVSRLIKLGWGEEAKLVKQLWQERLQAIEKLAK